MIDLDQLVPWVRGFADRLLQGSQPYGCFLWREQPSPNLLYMIDAVKMKWAVHDLASSAAYRDEWVGSINLFQYPEGGAYFYPSFERHSWQHATATALVALNMLEGAPQYPLAFLEPLRDLETCRQWVAAHRSSRELIPHHRYMLGPFVMDSGVPEGWADTFFSDVDALQDAGTGFWPETGGRPNISATFMFTILHLALGRELPRAERMLDTIIAEQGEDGLYNDRRTITYHDMDAAFLLDHLSRTLDYRREEAVACLRALGDTFGVLWDSDRERVFEDNPHQTLAIISLAAVLKQALADLVPGSAACRFFFTEASFFRVP